MDFKGPLPSFSRKLSADYRGRISSFNIHLHLSDFDQWLAYKMSEQDFRCLEPSSCIHSGSGLSFQAGKIKEYLGNICIATSRKIPYNPCERYICVKWKVSISFHKSWDLTVGNNITWSTTSNQITVLHCHQRHSTWSIIPIPTPFPRDQILPSWLTIPGPVFLRRNVRNIKHGRLLN